jgi:hypothetical protein
MIAGKSSIDWRYQGPLSSARRDVHNRAMHFAYIDPGSGSLLIQAIVAAVISVPFFFRRNIGALVQRVRGSHGGKTTPTQKPDTEG